MEILFSPSRRVNTRRPLLYRSWGDLLSFLRLFEEPFLDEQSMEDIGETHPGIAFAVAGLLIGLQGCTSQEPLPISLSLRPSPETAAEPVKSRVLVLVTPFADDRSDRTKLGVHKAPVGLK